MEDKKDTAKNSNLPAKLETSVVKKNPLLEGIKDEVAQTMIESILPKLKPFLKPAVEHIESFLGDNDNLVVLRVPKKGKTSQVVVLDNNEPLEISVRIDEKTGQVHKKFTASSKAVKEVFETHVFLELILSGKFK